MTQWTSDQIAQIRAVLAENRDGRAWARRLSTVHGQLDELTFGDVFSITVNDIAKYVEEYGWDPRTVCEVDRRPPSPDARASYYIYPRGSGWIRGSPGDRGEWIEHSFSSLEDARRDTSRVLLHIQWSAWNNENKWHLGLTGRLIDLYPPPPA